MLHYHEIFSPVVKLVSIHVVLALVVLLDLELEQLDVKTNFLHGDLYGTTRRFCTTLKRYISFQAQEIIVWPGTVSQTMVQEV